MAMDYSAVSTENRWTTKSQRNVLGPRNIGTKKEEDSSARSMLQKTNDGVNRAMWTVNTSTTVLMKTTVDETLTVHMVQ